MLDSLPRPCILAHRGASAHAPENTLAAFELALAQGADGIELDAQLSADGHVVVIHDGTVDRTTGAWGRVQDLPLTELRALDAGSFFSDHFKGERIPTLEEVFEKVGGRAFINVELKNYDTPRDNLVEAVCALIRKFEIQERILFSSFLPSNLSRARRILPEVPRALLADCHRKGWWNRSFGFVFGDYAALHLCGHDASPQQVARVHRLKRRIHVWTIDKPEHMRALFHWGADGIITNDPQLAILLRGERK